MSVEYFSGQRTPHDEESTFAAVPDQPEAPATDDSQFFCDLDAFTRLRGYELATIEDKDQPNFTPQLRDFVEESITKIDSERKEINPNASEAIKLPKAMVDASLEAYYEVTNKRTQDSVIKERQAVYQRKNIRYAHNYMSRYPEIKLAYALTQELHRKRLYMAADSFVDLIIAYGENAQKLAFAQS